MLSIALEEANNWKSTWVAAWLFVAVRTNTKTLSSFMVVWLETAPRGNLSDPKQIGDSNHTHCWANFQSTWPAG